MAKATIKKPKLTPEEQMAELARLTGSVAAISHMGTSQPFVLPGAAPAPEAATPQPTSAPATEPVPGTAETAPPAPPAPAVQSEPPTATAAPAPQPATLPEPAATAAPAEQKGEKAPAAAAPATPAAAAEELPIEDDQEEEEAEEELVAPTPAAAVEGKDKPDFTSLFAYSSEKKTFQVRVTASHQQFFQQMGLLLGGGASSTDVIHNILAQFKAANEGQIQKAFQRQLRQMMSPKK